MKTKASEPDLELAFDVGHSSIGWAVLRAAPDQTPSVNLLGCGVVTFRADDCLASARRGYRRQRRHIRSTRQRIARLKVLLKHLKVLTEEQLNEPGCAWPWQLAARVLAGGEALSWTELWDVLRWYAHNRGYDGNRRWSAHEVEAAAEDTEKEENARSLMEKHGTRSMAETFCKELGLDPLGGKRASMKRFKGLNAAFPRSVVEGEVCRILQAHVGKLPQVDAPLIRALLGDTPKDVEAWKAIPCPELKLPRRYQGALLFGQLVPRFDNRIISTCPVTGQKVPSRNCPEFFGFRWAMLLANIRVGKATDRDLLPLSADDRKALDALMRRQGALTPKELKDAVRAQTCCARDNLDTMFMHPDAKDALVLDPVQRLVMSDDLAPFWKVLPERLQKRLRGQWRRGKTFSLAQIRQQLAAMETTTTFDAQIQRRLDVTNTNKKKKQGQVTREQFLERGFPSKPLRLDGRAAYARPLLQKAYEEVMSGRHPKEEGGCLFITDEIRQAQLQMAIDEQTNNHLVRHRLLILERVVCDIVEEYAGGDRSRVARATIEVNRDLREMSGKSAKEKSQDLGLRLANFKGVSKKLEEALENERMNGKPIPITAGLIRKARIADDLGWTCPYTGKTYEPKHLVTRYVDKDHVVPRSERASDALDSLVITFSAINKWKAKRPAWQFVADEQGKPVPDMPNLSIVSLSRYKQFVEGLETFKGHEDDKRRKRRRKELMLLPAYEEKEFTPRDLTQTSQLVRLGAQTIKKVFADLQQPPVVVSLPGSVTGVVRKSWKVLGCLSLACRQVLHADGSVKTKTEIRDITHLHHALDACVLAFTSRFIPNNGRVWELIVKRPGRLTDAERNELVALGVFGFNAERRFELRDLDNGLKDQIRQRLAEKRVVQHIPARMDGLRVEQNTWGVARENEDGTVLVRQAIRQTDGSRKPKEVPEKKVKLLGVAPPDGVGKLAANKGVLVIPDNFGVAILDHAEKGEEKLVIIPWHLVHARIFKGFRDKNGHVLEKSIVERNGGKMPRILRNGQIIRVRKGTYIGTWKVTSIKNQKSGVKLNLGQPDTVNTEEEILDPAKKRKMRKVRPDCRHEASLSSIVSGGLEILKPSLAGIPIQPSAKERA